VKFPNFPPSIQPPFFLLSFVFFFFGLCPAVLKLCTLPPFPCFLVWLISGPFAPKNFPPPFWHIVYAIRVPPGVRPFDCMSLGFLFSAYFLGFFGGACFPFLELAPPAPRCPQLGRHPLSSARDFATLSRRGALFTVCVIFPPPFALSAVLPGAHPCLCPRGTVPTPPPLAGGAHCLPFADDW